MSNSAGIFQVDELLAEKLRGSGLEEHVEVIARIEAEHEQTAAADLQDLNVKGGTHSVRTTDGVRATRGVRGGRGSGARDSLGEAAGRAAWIALGVVVLVVIVYGGYGHHWSWTGINGHTATLWDWLHLLLLPFAAVLLPLWLRHVPEAGRR